MVALPLGAVLYRTKDAYIYHIKQLSALINITLRRVGASAGSLIYEHLLPYTRPSSLQTQLLLHLSLLAMQATIPFTHPSVSQHRTDASYSGTPQPPPAILLAAAPHPICMIPFYAQHRTELALRIREKKLSWGGDLHVKDAATGGIIFRLDGQALSLRARKGVYLHCILRCVEILMVDAIPFRAV
jgi:hypothetical protein